MQSLLAVAIGGALGSACRWTASLACLRWFAAPTMYATFAVNVVGCLLIGLLSVSPLGQRLLAHAAIGAGFLGGLTTFSTFSLETVRLLQHGSHAAAAVNVTASLAAGLLAVVLGMQLGRWLS